MSERDPYELLGIEPTASPEEIRAAFRRAVRRRHPDTAAGRSDDRSLGEVIDAYRLLIDPGTRARYDASRRGQRGRRIPVRRARQKRTESAPSTSSSDRFRCPDCGGRGRTQHLSPCPDCGGAGEITHLDRRGARSIPCRSCSGRGRIGSLRVCPRCGGTGLARS